MDMVVFWNAASRSPVFDRRFRGAYCLNQQGDLKRRKICTGLHGSASHKPGTFILVAVITSNYTYFNGMDNYFNNLKPSGNYMYHLLKTISDAEFFIYEFRIILTENSDCFLKQR
jgi:hypothetical protein